MLQKAHRAINIKEKALLYEKIEFQNYFTEQLWFFFSPFSHDTRALSIIQFSYSRGWIPFILFID